MNSVAAIQMTSGPDVSANLEQARPLLEEAAGRGAQVACLPELFRTQYFCQGEDPSRFDLAEPIPGPTTEALADVARQTHMVVVGSIFERRAAGLGMDAEQLRAAAVVGTPERLVERLAPFAALGVGDFLMMARPPADERSMQLLAAVVAPELRRLR